MAFNVNEFRQALVSDGARPNLFDIQFLFPAGVPSALTRLAGSNMTYMCKASQLPGVTLGTVPVQYFGRELKFAGNRTFQDWSVNIINDEDFTIRRAFEQWSSSINSHVQNLRTSSVLRPESYQSDAIVRQYGKEGKVIKTYKFVGLFPTDVAPIDVNWGDNDTIEEFSVTFAYQWWEADTTDSVSTNNIVI